MLPQFDEFMGLYPYSERLQVLLARIYDTYIKFCITAVQYLTQSKSLAVFSFIPSKWNKFQTEFARIMDVLKTENEEFMRQTFLNGAQVQNSISHIVADIRSSLPDVQRTPVADFPIFQLPYSQNPRFTGRDSEMDALREQLDKKSGNRPTCSVINGLGGVGKTQLAIEFAYCFR